MRPLNRVLILTFCLLASRGIVSAQDKFELRAPRPAPSHSLFGPPAGAPKPAASPAPTPDPNLLDLTRTIESSKLRAGGIVGRNDERRGINFEPGNVRTIAERANQQHSELERTIIVASLVAFAIFGCWFLFPKRKKKHRRKHRPELERPKSRSRFSY